MTFVTEILVKLGILKEDLDYHFVRASMVIIYFFFGYQKWFDYEAQGLIPFFTHGLLIFWMYPVFGVKGASYFLGVSEWLFSYVYNDDHHHPLYARWLGSICRRVSRHGRERCLSHEGCRSLGCIRVSPAAGCSESVTGRQRIFSRSRHAAPAHLIPEFLDKKETR